MKYKSRCQIAGAVVAVALMCTAALHAGEPDGTTLQVRVVDDSGAGADGAEAYLMNVAMGLPITKTWTAADIDGLITIAGDNISRFAEGEIPQGDVRLVVRAPGQTWSTMIVTLPREELVEMAVTKGRAIELRIVAPAGQSLPEDLEPIAYNEALGVAVWITRVQSFESREHAATVMVPSLPERRGPGEFVVRVPDDFESFSVLIDHPGFLRVFESEPIVIADLTAATATIELPRPVEVSVRMAPLEDAPAEYAACGVGVMHSPTVPGGWSFHVERRFGDGRSFETVFDDLAPGGYSFDGFTGDRETWNRKDRDDYGGARSFARLAAGETDTVELLLETYDEDHWKQKLKGDYNVTLDLNLSGGRPAAGKAYELAYSLRQFGRQVDLASGTAPDDGIVHLQGLPSGQVATIILSVDGEFLDQIFLRGEELSQRLEYVLAPAIGDLAPDFVMTSLVTGETLRLSDLRGQVVLLEFWASWCGPCQEPMLHNNDLMKRRGDSWRDRVTILGVSIDDEIETIRKHVDERDWNAVRQVWVAGAWKADATKMYAVTGVPSAFLIDAEGVIVWAGHPATIEPEEEIDALLQKRPQGETP